MLTEQMKERLHVIDQMQEMARSLILIGDNLKKMIVAGEDATEAVQKMNVPLCVAKRNRRVKYKTAS